MTITKYIHSCLLLEQDGQQLLFDPGTFSFIEELVKPGTFAGVSYIIITHNQRGIRFHRLERPGQGGAL